MSWLIEPCLADCADCAFDTHTESAWDFTVSAESARGYYAARRVRVNYERATPFVSDFQKREIFETVATLDVVYRN